MTTRLGLAIDLDRCIGCWACAVACKIENSVGEGLWWQRIETVGGAAPDSSTGRFPDVSKHYRPRNCFHCAEPPCLPACPEQAIGKRADGIVLIDPQRCTGCGDCVPACPYDAIALNAREPVFPPGLEDGTGSAAVAPRRAGIAEKCTLCVHRIDAGGVPACAAACPTAAIAFGDLDDPDDSAGRLRRAQGAFRLNESSGAEPSQWYRPPVTALGQRRSGQGTGAR
ncbi:MAG: 4Fe-4S dicluster domain-containing protein [Gammaproteobacteria bacterium]